MEMEMLSVQELYEELKKQIDKGNGDKKIVVSNDNEGNGYHGLYYTISDGVEMKPYENDLHIYDVESKDLEELVFLG